IRRDSGGGSELLARTLQAQKQTRAGEDLIIVAPDPLLFLRRRIPVVQQGREVLRLKVNERPCRKESRQRNVRRRSGPKASPCDRGAGQCDTTHHQHPFHGFTLPFGATAGAGVERASSRGRTTRSCSSASCSSGWRAAFACWIRSRDLRSAI